MHFYGPYAGRYVRPLLVALSLCLTLGSGFAADAKKDGKEGKEQARRLQQKLSALEQEKSQLDVKLKETGDQLDQAKQSVAAANQKRSSLEKKLKDAEEENSSLSAKLESAKKDIATVKATLAETQDNLRQTEDAKRRLDSTLTMRSGALAACETKNDSLYRLGGALIKRYEEKGCFDSLVQREPITQLGRVDMENQVEEYRQQLELERANQKIDAARDKRRQQEEADKRALAKADEDMAQQKRDEEERLQRLKKKQQGDLDKIGRKLKGFFENIEW